MFATLNFGGMLRHNVAHARQIGKPCLVVALEAGIEPATFREWLTANHIQVLNVAGPRESKRPGVYAAAVCCLETLLRVAPPWGSHGG